MSTRYNVDDIMKFKQKAYRLQLAAPNRYFNRSAEELTKVCNGVGGEGSKLSDKLTEIYKYYQTSASIHDEGYDAGGTEEDRNRIDREFRDNMYKEWEDRFGFWRWIKPKSIKERKKIKLAYVAVDLAGGLYFNYQS